jgi:hypothetical protein
MKVTARHHVNIHHVSGNSTVLTSPAPFCLDNIDFASVTFGQAAQDHARLNVSRSLAPSRQTTPPAGHLRR